LSASLGPTTRLERREFITIIGGLAAWPLAGHAQQAERARRVGVLVAFPESHPFAEAFVATFTQALGRLGWVEGKNIRLDYRFAAGDPALFKAYAVELVGLAPDAILASTAPALAALQQQGSSPPCSEVSNYQSRPSSLTSRRSLR
jgi:putative ABC transport system substrate-binding protein